MTWRTIMLDPRRCCICRRRLRPWHRARYLGLRCHAGCLAEQLAWIDNQNPWRVINPHDRRH